jgi:ParB family chromosome partitioning protein
MKRQALGRGLGALLSDRRPSGPIAEGFLQIELGQIHPNPRQPREGFDEAELEDLAASIRKAGVLQPILVREASAGGGFELIAGERRLRAARMAGLQRIPAMVQKTEEGRTLELALIENIQRQQLNPIEEARAFATMSAEYGLTQEEIAEKVGRKRPSIANSLRLLKLPERVQQLLRDGALTAGHAKALLSLADEEEVLKTAEAMLQGFVTVRGAEEMAREKKAAASTATPPRQDPNVHDAQERLQRALGTKVRIRQNAAGRGRIEIEFYDDEGLERLFEILEKGAR